MRRLGLRGRVTLASVAVLALALGALSLAGNLLLAARLSADADAVLRDRAAARLATINVRNGRLRAGERLRGGAIGQETWVYDAEGRAVLRGEAGPQVQAEAEHLPGANGRYVGNGLTIEFVPEDGAAVERVREFVWRWEEFSAFTGVRKINHLRRGACPTGVAGLLEIVRGVDKRAAAKAAEVLTAATAVMRRALEAGGTSFDALYVDVNGSSGYFDRALAVYGQEGRPCPRCGTAIRREPFMNRSSYRCPRCQRTPVASARAEAAPPAPARARR